VVCVCMGTVIGEIVEEELARAVFEFANAVVEAEFVLGGSTPDVGPGPAG
jgi:hypothetical protein